MPDLTPSQIANLKRVASAATPGPWSYDSYATVFAATVFYPPEEEDFSADPDHFIVAKSPSGGPRENNADLAHIAALDPPTVLSLIAMVEERDRALAEWTDAAKATDIYDYLVDALARMGTVGPRGIRQMIAYCVGLKTQIAALSPPSQSNEGAE